MSEKSKSRRNKVRIIAGRCRGRVISFTNIDGLRPTPDRVRETLFNWLQADIAGANCLDLFAGSGVLGIEALSRGASQVLAIEYHVGSAGMIRTEGAKLGLDQLEVITGKVSDFVVKANNSRFERFNIVFIDPPYKDKVLPEVFHQLDENDWLAPGAKIYFEANYAIGQDELPISWNLYKTKKAGQVYYYLAEYQ